MFQVDAWQGANASSAPLPPQRHTMPTIPCDLSEYARAETGPLSWSVLYDEPPSMLELEEPLDIDSWPEPGNSDLTVPLTMPGAAWPR